MISKSLKFNRVIVVNHTCLRLCSSNASKPNHPIVTILDAAHNNVGKYVALLLKQSPHLGELRLYDKHMRICPIAEDLSHIDTKTVVKSFAGPSVLKYAIMDADIVVTLGGCRTKIRESAKDLFQKNLDDVRTAALYMIEFNPKGIFCIAKPPIEAFVPLASEEYKKAGVYDFRKIIGITNVAGMRTNYYVSQNGDLNPSDVVCPIIGGVSPNCLVPVVSQCKPNKLHTQNHKSVIEVISQSEEEVLKLYGNCCSICITPALGISRFVNSLLKALNGDTSCVECAFIRQTGHIGQFLPYMTSVVRLGRHGILSSHMPKISGMEAHLLRKASMFIKENIRIGEAIVSGEQKPVIEREQVVTCDKPSETLGNNKDEPLTNAASKKSVNC